MLKFNSREQVTANPTAINHESRSYRMNNFPPINWCINRNKEDKKSSSNTDPLKGAEKRCKNSAETSKAMAIRIVDLSDSDIAEPDAADIGAGSGRFTLYL